MAKIKYRLVELEAYRASDGIQLFSFEGDRIVLEDKAHAVLEPKRDGTKIVVVARNGSIHDKQVPYKLGVMNDKQYVVSLTPNNTDVEHYAVCEVKGDKGEVRLVTEDFLPQRILDDAHKLIRIHAD